MQAGYFILVAMGVFVALILAAARIGRRAVLALTPDEKARLVDASAHTSLVWFVLAALLAGAWFAVVLFLPGATPSLAPLVVCLFLLLSSLALASTYRRYRQLGLPSAFLRAVAVSRMLRLLGVAVLLGALVFFLRQAAPA